MGAYSDILRTLAATGQRFVVAPPHLIAIKRISALPKDHGNIAALLGLDPSSGGQDVPE